MSTRRWRLLGALLFAFPQAWTFWHHPEIVRWFYIGVLWAASVIAMPIGVAIMIDPPKGKKP